MKPLTRGYAFATLKQFLPLAHRRTGADAPRARDALARFVRLGLPLYCGAPRGRYLALTLDDGPGPYSSTVLRDLRRDRAHATFFLVGENLERYPRLPRAERRIGALGDHTWTHPPLTRIPPTRMVQEITRTQQALARASGGPIQLFRPPYGFHNGAVDREVRSLGMLEVLWSLDSHDSYPTDAPSGQILANVARYARPGSIVLLHEVRPNTVAALPAILAELNRRGFKLVSIPELLALDPPSRAQLHAGTSGCPSAPA